MKITILKLNEVADLFGVHPRTIRRRLNKNSRYYDPDFPVVQIVGTRRFIKEQVEAYWSKRSKEDRVVTDLSLPELPRLEA